MVECRRILKWTYAYGYYSFQPAEERRKGSPPAATKEQQGFFEFNQARLASNAVHCDAQSASGQTWGQY